MSYQDKPKEPFYAGKLIHKLQISGDIVLQTGLHIGGSEVDLDIGGLDNEVAKIKIGNSHVPYIPGSSLKGKMRSLIGRMQNSPEPKTDTKEVKSLFGDADSRTRGRLIFRDSYLKEDTEYNLENKSENTIDRVKGSANPRNMERVTKGAVFEFDLVVDIYERDNEEELLNILRSGLNLLTYDYLGGSGSRGYGQVAFENLQKRKIRFELRRGEVIFGNYEPFKLKN